MDEFDLRVNEYNEWLADVNVPKKPFRFRLKAFLSGVCSVSYLLGQSKPVGIDNPLDKYELTPKQKDSIKLASDVKRSEIKLEEMLENGIVGTGHYAFAKKFYYSTYDSFRRSYSQK